MKKLITLLLFGLFTGTSFAASLPDSNLLSIIPRPANLKMGKGQFTLTRNTPVSVKGLEDEARKIAGVFTERLYFSGGPSLKISSWDERQKGQPMIIFELKPSSGSKPESYTLTINPSVVHLKAASGAGLFRGLQTLFQIFPSEIVRRNLPMTYKEWTLPALMIKDYPRYSYRGMHLDVSRHFFPKEFVKKYIDLIAMYRMNTFHWHLTDDNGWRIEIKKYPELTKTAAWRVDHEDKPWGDRPLQKPGEPATYGGFYTQDDIREIVRYAADRYITVIPEIEMPAHSIEVLAAYPEFSCKGGPFTVPPGSYWPNSDILCAGNDSVFTFLQDVLTEVIELFPSQYIHIGGDEADRTNWKTCPKCQSRKTAEGLKDEKELQSYFIRRIEKFVVEKNRKIIGWDEILEGGLAPEATVMSWRGFEGGIAAARQGHDAFMTPTSHCYFDYYQADPEFEPVAIGGFTTLRKVYSYEPTPAELTEKEAKHILGTQGNLWTEFIQTTEQVEYMVLPRMIALAEVAWTQPGQKDWHDFRARLEEQFIRLQKMQTNFSRGSFKVEVSTRFDLATRQTNLVLESEQVGLPIHFTLEGNDVTSSSPVYKAPLPIKGNGIVRAGIFADGKLKEKLVEMPLLFHKALGMPVKYQKPYSYRYTASGPGALTDGLRGTVNHRDGYWQGFHGQSMEVIIDLGQETPVNTVQTNFLQNQKSWIFLPEFVEYSLSSDGKKYHSFNEVLHKVSPKEEKAIIQPFNFQFLENTKARYIRVKAKSLEKCPAWHDGAGEPCWIFTDEIVVF
jgi:hexosaminidase